ncbi:hypothetical protein IFR05_007657 [Cadophora sp. M221]|nr:hypothetical protein IFR05_007657 [Cadophora sp. M221]
MGAFYETIPKSLITWILEQKVFWIASAPLSASGHINVSPKGGQYFGIVDAQTFWYVDLTGSGVETLSHLQEPGNGRITVLFNAFEGAPKIVRLWGWGEVLEYGTEKYVDFVKKNEVKTIAGTRAVVVVHIHQVGSSCGFSMPYYDFKDFRPTLNEFFEKRVAAEEAGNKKDGIENYWAFKNSESMDGLPGMRRAVETSKKENIKPIKKMVGPYALDVRPRRNSTRENISQVGIVLVAFCLGLAAQYGWRYLNPQTQTQTCKA